MKVAIFGKQVKVEFKAEISLLFDALKKHNIDYIIFEPFKIELEKIGIKHQHDSLSFSSTTSALLNEVSFFLSIGGDGTFLDSMLYTKERNIPILGINTGRLGFLSNTPTSKINTAIENIVSKNYSIETRSLLELNSPRNLFDQENVALNEISIMKRDSSSMITIQASLDDKHLNTYWADGLIISTSTGSTAYSLSCGGPILMPGGGNFVVTPIAPHNLNVRPIVISDNSILKIQVESRGEKNLVALDSRSQELNDGEILSIKKAKQTVSLVQFEHQSFLNNLRYKLNWGLDKRNSNV